MAKVKKIVVIGPESTGKSTLCSLLAAHFNTLWCPEYAREYLLQHGTNYSYEDLLTIAKGQVALEDECLEKVSGERERGLNEFQASLLFVDTDMQVMKVWCEFVFGKCHKYILEQISQNDCDLYLLCNIDLPWVKDELREYPDLETRKELFDIYQTILFNQKIPCALISGSYEERFQTAVEAVNNLLLVRN